MVVTYHSLQLDFDRKVRKLQATCRHQRLSTWAEEWYAVGHSTGNVIKRCLRCNKVIKKELLIENYRKRLIK